MNKEGQETNPIFDFNVADWDYLAMISIAILFAGMKEESDLMYLIYRDGGIKVKGRVKFPSGSCLSMEQHGFSTPDQAIEHLVKAATNMPEATLMSKCIIYNTTTKGSDLFNLMKENPNMEITYRTEKRKG